MFSLVLAILCSYLGFLLWIRRGLGREYHLPEGDRLPSATVIVAARNEEDNLPHLLAALKDQSIPGDRFEIIVVDDGSTDKTAEILTQWARDLPNLHLIHLDETPADWAPKKWALAVAIKRATGEVILATDADCRPGTQWVQTILQYFVDDETGMVYGPAPLVGSRHNAWAKALFLDSCAVDALAAAGTGLGMALTCTGRNLAYRRRVFDEVGGYEDVAHFISGDDDLLMQKIAATGHWKIRFALNPAAVVSSPQPAGFKAFVRQRLRFASKGLAYYGIPTSLGLKLVLPFIYVASLAAAGSILSFLYTGNVAWMLPLALKLAGEAGLVYTYLHRVGRRVGPGIFLLTGLVHPFYVVLFGVLGNFLKISWKDREYSGREIGPAGP